MVEEMTAVVKEYKETRGLLVGSHATPPHKF